MRAAVSELLVSRGPLVRRRPSRASHRHRRRHQDRVPRVGQARRFAGRADPRPRDRRPRLGTATGRVRSQAPLHRSRQPRYRSLRRAARPLRPWRMAADVIAVMDDARRANARTSLVRRWAASSRRSSPCCTPTASTSLTLACTACHHHEWRRELLRRMGERRGRERHAGTDGRRHALAHRPALATPVRRVRQRPRPPAHQDEAARVRRAGRRDPRMRPTNCASSCRT